MVWIRKHEEHFRFENDTDRLFGGIISKFTKGINHTRYGLSSLFSIQDVERLAACLSYKYIKQK